MIAVRTTDVIVPHIATALTGVMDAAVTMAMTGVTVVGVCVVAMISVIFGMIWAMSLANVMADI